MSVAGGRRIYVLPFMITLIMILVLQIWVSCDCKVGAIRILSEDLWASEKEVVVVEEQGNNMINNKKNEKNIKEDDSMLKKYFNGRNFDLNTTEKGLEDSKRRVPSCPDPLHNKLKSVVSTKELEKQRKAEKSMLPRTMRRKKLKK